MNNLVEQNRDINSLNSVARDAATLFINRCKEKGINIFVTEYRRTKERQMYLYCKGRTIGECIKVGIDKSFAEKYCSPNESQVTWTLTSNHMEGFAWDIACSSPTPLYDNFTLSKAGIVARELGIEWGGDWKEKDTPHFQVDKNWKSPYKNAPQWQIDSLKSICKDFNLDEDVWLKKINDGITVGELFGILNKTCKR